MVIIAICLAIYGIFSYQEIKFVKELDEQVEFKIAEELVRAYGEEFLPIVVDRVTDQVSDRMVRYLTILVGSGVLKENECQEAITKTRDAYNKELERDKRGS